VFTPSGFAIFVIAIYPVITFDPGCIAWAAQSATASWPSRPQAEGQVWLW